MYAYIDGKLTFKCPTHVVIEAGGIGYHINISLHTYAALKEVERQKLYTWLQVKEDAHTLYGFADESERKIFLHLISVSGIGASTARMMLSSMNPAEIQGAILRNDLPLIQRIKGIGAKSAQRLVLELKDRLMKEGVEVSPTAPVYYAVKEEALAALVMLGFSQNIAEKALETILKSNTALSVEELIKSTLKVL